MEQSLADTGDMMKMTRCWIAEQIAGEAFFVHTEEGGRAGAFRSVTRR